jgi:ABC-2 type transport system permease protein
MTDHLDVSRELSNNIFNLPEDDLKKGLLEEYPFLQNTLYASDTSTNAAIVNRSVSGLINSLNKNVSISIEFSSKKKNKFIKRFSKLNPVTTFQNEINAVAETDFYAYRNYREQIQETIDKKIELILMDTWNEVVVGKQKYIQYIEKFK